MVNISVFISLGNRNNYMNGILYEKSTYVKEKTNHMFGMKSVMIWKIKYIFLVY